MQLQIFPSINMDLPLDSIYRRLGYRDGVTKMADREREGIKRSIDHAASLVSLRGAGLRLPIIGIEKSSIVIGYGAEIRSGKLANFLRGCGEVLLMGATAGDRVMDAIRMDTEGEDITRGVIVDAVASEMTDAALDWISIYFNRILVRENARLTKGRFSAGYGDFLLENQRKMFDLLELHRIGVDIKENNILIPEKSVTAVAGIMR